MARTLPIRLRTIAAATVVIASGLIIFNAYQSIIYSTDQHGGTLPIIAGPKEPFRVMPEDPGGMVIPHKGSLLFDVLRSDNEDDLALDGIKMSPAEVEEPSILENEEEGGGFELPSIPETRTESLYGLIEDLKHRPENEKTAVEVSVPSEEGSDEVQQEDIKPAVIEEVIDDQISIAVIPQSKPKRSVKKTFSLDRILSKDMQQKRYYIQLASLKNKEDAQNIYQDIRDQFPRLVEGLSVFFPQADLGDRGLFTRVQIGPLSETEAKKRCADYSASSRGGTCLVLSR